MVPNFGALLSPLDELLTKATKNAINNFSLETCPDTVPENHRDNSAFLKIGQSYIFNLNSSIE